MWRQIIFVLPLALSTLAIRVPVEGKDSNVTTTPSTKTTTTDTKVAEKKQDIYYIPQQADVDSYLIPPDPHRLEEVLPDVIVTPATYLLPPSPEKQIDYYVPTEAGEQTDWYPIQPVPVESAPANLLPPAPTVVTPDLITENQTYQTTHNPRDERTHTGSDQYNVPVPSRQLEPPSVDAPNDYIVPASSVESEVPSAEIDEKYYIPIGNEKQILQKPVRKSKKIKNKIKGIEEPTLPLYLTPPRLVPQIYKKPTQIYPKKVVRGYQPIPIPIIQFEEDSSPEILLARPVKPLKPISSEETEYYTPSDEKKLYLYEQAEQKRKLRGENEFNQQPDSASEETYGVNVPAEQETSETIFRQPGPNALNLYPVPHPVRLPVVRPARLRLPNLRRPPPRPEESEESESQEASKESAGASVPPPGDRTEFRMHGMKGPHSYQFGFDTGKGKNRQFRYEERDNDGHVKGHYGYVDKSGKLRVVNYGADPQNGFHADAPVEKE